MSGTCKIENTKVKVTDSITVLGTHFWSQAVTENSHNVLGLNTPEKRTSILKEIKKTNPSVIFLQETHLKSGAVQKIGDKYYPQVFHATNPDPKTKGVSILIHKNARVDISQQHVDPQGRFLFLKGQWDTYEFGKGVFP